MGVPAAPRPAPLLSQGTERRRLADKAKADAVSDKFKKGIDGVRAASLSAWEATVLSRMAPPLPASASFLSPTLRSRCF